MATIDYTEEMKKADLSLRERAAAAAATELKISGASKVILFGSVATGCCHWFSDVDIAVEWPTKTDEREKNQAMGRAMGKGYSFGIDVDITEVCKLREEVAREVSFNGKQL